MLLRCLIFFFVSPMHVGEILTLLGKHLPESEILRQGLSVISKLSSLFSGSTYPVNLVSVDVPFVWGKISRFGHCTVESPKVSTLFEKLGIDVGLLLSNRENLDSYVLSRLEKRLRFLRGLRRLGISGSGIGIIDVKFSAVPYVSWNVFYPDQGICAFSSTGSNLLDTSMRVNLIVLPSRKLDLYRYSILKTNPNYLLSKPYLYTIYIYGNIPQDFEQAILKLHTLKKLNIIENWKEQIRETIDKTLKILRENKTHQTLNKNNT